ncbi:uncharacterized protein LOC120090589 [Benincasa hispida]|uniref:uncharacterized protein LOC120090589 n=1 Tax=Benincasa hispida TaxID=102211 RepID=UPI0019018B5C|nr:uncharacterized protein LOC120090589 [Benincasa hispida]
MKFGEQMRASFAQELAANVRVVQDNPEKNYGIEHLKALGATTFLGTAYPADVEKWMEVVEKCFGVMRCPDDRKVVLATFLLQEVANDWWRMTQLRHGDRQTSWEEFKSFFYDKFYLRSFRNMKRNEFLKLVQGTMSVAEYEKKYTELSKYAISVIEDKRDRCRRFKDGLREDIRTPVTASVECNDFAQLVETTMRVERSISEKRIEREATTNARPSTSFGQQRE